MKEIDPGLADALDVVAKARLEKAVTEHKPHSDPRGIVAYTTRHFEDSEWVREEVHVELADRFERLQEQLEVAQRDLANVDQERLVNYERLKEQLEAAQRKIRVGGYAYAGLRDRMEAENTRLLEQLEAERGLADVFRRVLAQSHSLSGMSLMISGQTVEITEQEFDLVWNALDEIDGEDYTVRLPNPASDPLRLAEADADLAAGRARPASEVFADLELEATTVHWDEHGHMQPGPVPNQDTKGEA